MMFCILLELFLFGSFLMFLFLVFLQFLFSNPQTCYEQFFHILCLHYQFFSIVSVFWNVVTVPFYILCFILGFFHLLLLLLFFQATTQTNVYVSFFPSSFLLPNIFLFSKCIFFICLYVRFGKKNFVFLDFLCFCVM